MGIPLIFARSLVCRIVNLDTIGLGLNYFLAMAAFTVPQASTSIITFYLRCGVACQRLFSMSASLSVLGLPFTPVPQKGPSPYFRRLLLPVFEFSSLMQGSRIEVFSVVLLRSQASISALSLGLRGGAFLVILLLIQQ